MAEVNHRSKNLLAVVQAIVNQTASVGEPATFASTFAARLQGLAANQDLLVESDWRGVELKDILLAQLSMFKDLLGSRITLRGPAVQLRPAASQAIGMAIHELATNAAKYGSLSLASGQIHVSWDISASSDPSIIISWTESGGPAVLAPTRTGFGRLVVGRIVEAAVQGKVEMSFPPSGVTWRLVSRLRELIDEN
jgi:two-component sensor histidine kinase